jgi:hypothetical protein
VRSDRLRREWHFYIDLATDELLIKTKNSSTRNKFNIHPQQRQGYSLQADGHTNELPARSVPVALFSTAQAFHIGQTSVQIPIYPEPTIGTFETFLTNLPKWESTLLEHVSLHCDFYTLHHCLSTGQACIGVSNGSVRGDMGAFGWCISKSNGQLLATGMGLAQGMAPSSYRAEGYGMLAMLRFLVRLCEFCGSNPLGTAMFCDNQALVNRVAKRLWCTRWYPNKTITSDWDIIQAIISTLQAFETCPNI